MNLKRVTNNSLKFMWAIVLFFASLVFSNAQCILDDFANDLAGSNATELQAFLDETADGFSSWKVVRNARGSQSLFKTDIDLLKKVAELRNDAQFLDRIGGEQGLQRIIQANVRARCKSCGSAGAAYLKHIDDYLDDVRHLVDNYNDVDGFADVITDLKRINSSGSPNLNVEGAAFMLRIIKENDDTFLNSITKFEGSIDDLTNGCKYDLQFSNGQTISFGEFKSYAENSIGNFAATGKATYQQLTTYLSSLNSIDELIYFFDAAKISDIGIIKNRFKTVFKNNAEDIFNANQDLFKQFDRLDGTGKIDDWEDFLELVSDDNFVNHPMLDFIVLN